MDNPPREFAHQGGWPLGLYFDPAIEQFAVVPTNPLARVFAADDGSEWAIGDGNMRAHCTWHAPQIVVASGLAPLELVNSVVSANQLGVVTPDNLPA